MRAIRAFFFWVLVVLVPSAASAQSGTGQFLLISDIHFDPFSDGSLFAQLNAEPAEHWADVLAKPQPAALNARGTDSNCALVQSSLDDARLRIPNPDFILFAGDLMAHEWQKKYDALAKKPLQDDPESYRAFTTKAIRFLAGQFRQRYSATPVIPTLGNDDSYCGDYMVEPEGPFLKMFADVWAPLLAANDEEPAVRETFARGGFFTMRLPGVKQHRLIVLNSI
jgi:sphingomyelin phosphodiesterase acid-like 3